MTTSLCNENYIDVLIDSHGVLNVQGENFVFVSKAHPVIDLLRLNKEILNADIDDQPLIDDQWYKVTKQVMSTCCQQLKVALKTKVLGRHCRPEPTEYANSPSRRHSLA